MLFDENAETRPSSLSVVSRLHSFLPSFKGKQTPFILICLSLPAPSPTAHTHQLFISPRTRGRNLGHKLGHRRGINFGIRYPIPIIL